MILIFAILSFHLAPGHSRRRHVTVKRTDETIWAGVGKKMESIVKFNYMLPPLCRESKGVYRTNSRGGQNCAKCKKIASASAPGGEAKFEL